MNSARALEWETLEGCRFINAGGNGGDLFHVQHDGKSYRFRLYFVEAPATSRENRAKFKEQGDYFHSDEENLLKAGKDSAAFTLKFLAGRTFTVRTCWEEIKDHGSSTAYYALVEKDSRSLVEALTEAGLVSLRGMAISGTDSPLHLTADRYLAKPPLQRGGRHPESAGHWAQDRGENHPLHQGERLTTEQAGRVSRSVRPGYRFGKQQFIEGLLPTAGPGRPLCQPQ